MKLKIIISILLLLILLVPALAWVHGVNSCGGTNFLLGTGCSDVLLTGGSVQLTAN